jgi:hypothetical protein
VEVSRGGLGSCAVTMGQTEIMSESVYSCGLYVPGHDVHWIQANLSVKHESERPWEPGRLVDVHPDGSIVVEIQGAIRRLWNHNPERLARLAALNDGAISHQPGFHLLSTPSSQGSYLFCVADAESEELRPCPSDPPTGDLVDLLRNAGGFSIPGREALGEVASEREP